MVGLDAVTRVLPGTRPRRWVHMFEASCATAPQPRGHDHFVALYDHDAQLAREARAFLADTLGEGGMAVTALSPAHQAAVDRELRLCGIDVDAARADGSYLAVDADQALCDLVVDGVAQVDAFNALLDPILAASADRGSGLRLCGELAPRTWASGDAAGALALEELWDRLPAHPSLEIMCFYTSQQLRAAEVEQFLELCQQHSDLLPVESSRSAHGSPAHSTSMALLQLQAWAACDDRARLWDRVSRLESELLASLAQSADLQHNFTQALTSRDMIGQAKGMLMSRWSIDEHAAFDLLRTASNLQNVKLRETARAVIDKELDGR